MDDITLQQSSWTGGDAGHICNCIGCCRECGMCRTSPDHSRAMCLLIQKQAEERAALTASENRWRHRVPAGDPLEGSQKPQDAQAGPTGIQGHIGHVGHA